MLKPPAEYTADNANPTTVALISDTRAAIATMAKGNKKTGHKGGLFLLGLLRISGVEDAPAGPGDTGELGYSWNADVEGIEGVDGRRVVVCMGWESSFVPG